MKCLSSKANNFNESIIRGMTSFAVKYDAINLGQGFPEFLPPKEILDRLEEISHDGKFQQYPISHGSKHIRDALSKKEKYFTGVDYDPENEIIITCGGTEAMTATILALCNPGDQVAFFTPLYENYNTSCILAGATPVYIPLLPDKNYTFDANLLEETFKKNPNIKAMIVCNPSNPSGRVFTFEEMTIIANLAKKYDIYIITDEVYEHIVYKPNKMTYMSNIHDMRERTIICGSLSKTYSITGWRIGYVIATKNIADKIKKVHNFLTISAPAPLMEAATVGLNFKQDYYDNLLELYTKNRDILIDGFDKIGIKYNKPEGTYFMLIDLKEQMEKCKEADNLKFAQLLCEKIRICVVPCNTFFANQNINGIFRIHFAKNENTLYEALNRFEKIKHL